MASPVQVAGEVCMHGNIKGYGMRRPARIVAGTFIGATWADARRRGAACIAGRIGRWPALGQTTNAIPARKCGL